MILFLSSLFLFLRLRKVRCETCYKTSRRYSMVRRNMVPFYPYNVSILRCKDPNPFAVTEEFAPCRHYSEDN